MNLSNEAKKNNNTGNYIASPTDFDKKYIPCKYQNNITFTEISNNFVKTQKIRYDSFNSRLNSSLKRKNAFDVNKENNSSQKPTKIIKNASLSISETIKQKKNKLLDCINSITINMCSDNSILSPIIKKPINEKETEFNNQKGLKTFPIINNEMNYEKTRRLGVKSFDLKEKKHVPSHFMNKFNLNYLINRKKLDLKLLEEASFKKGIILS